MRSARFCETAKLMKVAFKVRSQQISGDKQRRSYDFLNSAMNAAGHVAHGFGTWRVNSRAGDKWRSGINHTRGERRATRLTATATLFARG